MTGTARLAGGK